MRVESRLGLEELVISVDAAWILEPPFLGLLPKPKPLPGGASEHAVRVEFVVTDAAAAAILDDGGEKEKGRGEEQTHVETAIIQKT